ncbi:MAG: site-2 protease family protein [Bacilli bacterium]
MLLNKINIPFYTIIYLIAVLLFNRFGSIFLFLVCSFIHELFHCIVARIFNVDIVSINVTPLGCSAQLDNVEKLVLKKKIMIFLAGPFSCFVIIPFLSFLYKTSLINENQFNMLANMNIVVFIFNLLPLSILDGGHIIDAIIFNKFDIFKASKIQLIYNIISTFCISIYLIIFSQYILLCFIILHLFMMVIFYKRNIKNLLRKRLYMNKDFLPIKINNDKIIYRDYENFYLENENLIHENFYIYEILKNK